MFAVYFVFFFQHIIYTGSVVYNVIAIDKLYLQMTEVNACYTAIHFSTIGFGLGFFNDCLKDCQSRKLEHFC